MLKVSILSIVSLLVLANCSKNEVGQTPPEAVNMADLPGTVQFTPAEVQKQCLENLQELMVVADNVGQITMNSATFANTAAALRAGSAKLENNLGVLVFQAYTASDPEVKKAGAQCESDVSNLKVRIYSRPDIFRVLQAAANKNEPLNPEQKFLLRELQGEFQRRGAGLAESTLAQVNQKQEKLVELAEKFSTELSQQASQVELVDEADLVGVPDSILQSLPKDPATGLRAVALRDSIVGPVIANAEKEEVRKRLQTKYLQVGGKENEKILEELFTVRHELAKLMGHRNFSSYVLQRNLARDPQRVLEFLKTTGDKLQGKNRVQLAKYRQVKRLHLGNPALELNSWDVAYYKNRLKTIELQFNPAEIADYFPVDAVMKGMFDIYQRILEVQFEEVPGAPVWHPDVKLYRVLKDNKTMAYFYTDLYPRKGKYSHFAMFDLYSTYQKEDGSRVIPVSAIVGNFSPPANGKPSLLSHSQVKTMFHEFGHVMHASHIKTQYRYFGTDNTFSSSLAKLDFVEAPSQMLEHWVWETSTLAELSGHYTDRSRKLPPELVQKLVESKSIDEDAGYWLRQVALATIDLTYHSGPNAVAGASTKIYHQKYKELVGLDLPEGTMPQSSWPHLVGYESTYYGYLWAKTYAEDMFTRFQGPNLLSPQVGSDYANFILTPGPTLDPLETVTKFLGRRPNLEAFYKNMGVNNEDVSAEALP